MCCAISHEAPAFPGFDALSYLRNSIKRRPWKATKQHNSLLSLSLIVLLLLLLLLGSRRQRKSLRSPPESVPEHLQRNVESEAC